MLVSCVFIVFSPWSGSGRVCSSSRGRPSHRSGEERTPQQTASGQCHVYKLLHAEPGYYLDGRLSVVLLLDRCVWKAQASPVCPGLKSDFSFSWALFVRGTFIWCYPLVPFSGAFPYPHPGMRVVAVVPQQVSWLPLNWPPPQLTVCRRVNHLTIQLMTDVNSAFHPSRVGKSNTSLPGWS